MADQGMPTDRIQAIREAAYRIWQSEGCPEGCDLEHWLRAEREVALQEAPADAATEATADAAELSASALKLAAKEETRRWASG